MSKAIKLPPISEREFQAQILQAAHHLGWVSYHTRYSIKSDPGWPDLVLARPPRIVFIEVKKQSGKATPAQAEWLRTLMHCGCEAYLFRPSDWPEIERVLR